MVSDMATPKQELIKLLYHGNLDEDIARAIDYGRSWRDIAHDVTEDTGVRVSHESLRQWYGAEDGAA